MYWGTIYHHLISAKLQEYQLLLVSQTSDFGFSFSHPRIQLGDNVQPIGRQLTARIPRSPVCLTSNTKEFNSREHSNNKIGSETNILIKQGKLIYEGTFRLQLVSKVYTSRILYWWISASKWLSVFLSSLFSWLSLSTRSKSLIDSLEEGGIYNYMAHSQQTC